MLKDFFRTCILFAILAGTWFLLSGVTEPLYLIYGLASTAFVLWIAIRMNLADREGQPFHLATTAPLYWLWLFKEMLKSGWLVTKFVWQPKMKIKPHLAWVKLSQTTDLGRTIYANSITLTPGTVSVEIEEKRILVHALSPETIEELREGDMDQRVTTMAQKHREGL